MAGQADDDSLVVVPRHLLREVLADGCCPLHLRLQLSYALASGGSRSSAAPAAGPVKPAPGDAALWEHNEDGCGKLAVLDRRCLSAVAEYLTFADVLEVRACSREPLQWAMQRGGEDARLLVHDRIRTRLWIRRITDVTRGTRDESIFETRLKSLADEALRVRMETEMQEALAHMEEQIRAFQSEVDRRLEEQERHVRRLVEDRVQQELDTILAAEVVKVQAMVEQRVRERVTNVFQREVRETVRDLQGRLDALLEDNEVLRDAFAEAAFRSRCLFWAMFPPPLRPTAPLCLRPWLDASPLGLRRRLELACCWPEVDFDVALGARRSRASAG